MKRLIWVVLLASLSAASWGQSFNVTCPNAEIFGSKMLTGVCWSCLLPIHVFGKVNVTGNKSPVPDGVDTKPVCACSDNNGVPMPGVTVSLWMPAKVIEVVKVPFCSPTLGGVILGSGNIDLSKVQGLSGSGILDVGGHRFAGGYDERELSRYQVHAFDFPLMTIMGFLSNVNCLHGESPTIDLTLPPTEFLPNWNDAELGSLVAPESLLFGNPIAQASCGLDCVASSTGHPLSSMFWCAGCWGLNVPMDGNIVSPRDAVRETSLLASRYLEYNHRMGTLKKSYGSGALCGKGSYAWTIPKQQYRMSMLYPVPEAQEPLPGDAQNANHPGGVHAGSDVNKPSTGACCHYIGENTYKWGIGREIPGPGENMVYMLYQFHQCCLTM